MALIPLTLDQVARQYPALLEELVGKIRSSKSRARDDALESFTWGIQYEVRGKASNLKELLQRRPSPRPTVEERLQRLQETILVSLMASKKQRSWAVPLATIPEGIVAQYRSEYERLEAAYRGKIVGPSHTRAL